MVVGTSIAMWSIGAFAFYLVAGRALGPEAYGLVAALQSVIVVAAQPITGLQWSVARVIASAADDRRQDAQATYRRALIRTTSWATGLAVVATGVTIALSERGHSIPLWPLIVTYASIVAVIPLFLAAGALQGERRYKGLAWSYASSGILRAPILLVLLALPLSKVDASMLAVGLAIAIGATWAVALTRSDLRVRQRPATDTWRAFLRSLPAVMIGLIGIAVLTNVDVVAAKLAIGGDEAGLFGAASVVAKALLVVPQALTIVLLPRVARRKADGGNTGSLLAAGIVTMAIAGVVAMALAVPLAEPVMRIAFGPQFAAAANLLVPFLGATTLLGALLILVNHHVARNDHRFVWTVGGLAVLEILLLIFFSTSGDAIIAIDALVAAVGLIIHELMYFNTDESMLRGAGAQFAAIMRRVTGRDRGAA